LRWNLPCPAKIDHHSPALAIRAFFSVFHDVRPVSLAAARRWHHDLALRDIHVHGALRRFLMVSRLETAVKDCSTDRPIAGPAPAAVLWRVLVDLLRLCSVLAPPVHRCQCPRAASSDGFTAADGSLVPDNGVAATLCVKGRGLALRLRLRHSPPAIGTQGHCSKRRSDTQECKERITQRPLSKIALMYHQ
jgi:hypothetical protein